MTCSEGMGSVEATISLSNPRQPRLHPMAEVKVLAHSGALLLWLPKTVVRKVQVDQVSMREVTVADGRVMQVPCVGPVRLADQADRVLWEPWWWVAPCSWARLRWKPCS